jgi:predicted ABC-type exoprotein transport system permease subunit
MNHRQHYFTASKPTVKEKLLNWSFALALGLAIAAGAFFYLSK